MKPIAGWILSILAIVILGTVADLMLHGNRMQKYIRAIFSTIIVLVIVTPLPNLIKNGFKLEGNFIIEDNLVLDQEYLDYINSNKTSYMEKGLLSALERDGISGATVKITAVTDKFFDIKKVEVNIKNLVITGWDEHINKYELVEEKVTKYLNIDKGILVINE